MTEARNGLAFIEARELPYLTGVPRDGRSIPISDYYDADARCFYVYSLRPDRRILVLRPIECIEGTYLAKAAANERVDCRLPFLETMIQHFSFADVCRAVMDAVKDLINGLSSLHKYFVLLNYVNGGDDFSGRPMISTELEYAFGNHRAFYDCLQGIIQVLGKWYRPTHPELPESFAKIEAKSAQDLEKYRLPPALIDFYNARKDIFLTLRKVRDHIFHRGYSPDEIYVLNDGFATTIDEEFGRRLGDLNLWPEGLPKPNRLGSLLAVFEFLVRDMFDAMNHVGNALVACFKDPPLAIASGYQLFLRSSVSKHLASLDTYRQQHWFDPRVVLGIAPADSPANDGGLRARNGG